MNLIKRKVLAYITKGEGDTRELLVFAHKEFPKVGYQVPGGTVEDDELLPNALFREIEEESGIKKEELILLSELYQYSYVPDKRNVIHERNIFHLSYIGKERFQWEHEVKGEGVDKGLIFCYRWIPLNEFPELAAQQDIALHLL